ncbi:beta strand repeat-containing protein [Pseudomonas putida]|uniref:beta strand repeat-containing protein n=1 Tax=Pseudomonas putida TaxID=303 RepID=UPI00370B8EC3
MAASTYFAQVQQLYISYFGRPADTIGQAYWAGIIDAANGDIAAVQAGFSASSESQALYGNKTTIDKVTAIYQNVFGRSPEPAGLTYWVAQIDSGKVTQAQAAWTIQQSAGAGDALVVQNKLVAAQAFTAQIDTTAEIQGYQGATAAQAGRDFLNGVTTTASAQAAVTNAASALANAIVNGGAVGTTYTLTTGIDNFVGTAGNDVFVGGNGATNTFGPADQLDGGAGNDTVKLYGGAAGNASIPTIKNIENVYLNGTTGDLNVSGIAGVNALEVDNVAAATFTLGAAQSLKLSNQTAATVVAGSVAGGVTLNGVGTAAAALALTVPAAAASLNLNTVTKASNVDLTGAALTTLKVTGDQALTLSTAAALTSVDASAATGGVNYTGTTATDLTFVGGAGADRVNLGASITAADKLDGGAGTDTLAITTGGYTAAAVAGVKNFEVLETVGSTVQDAGVFAANNTLTGLTVGAVAAATTYTTEVTNLAAGVKDNIKVTDTTVASTLTLSIKDFVSGGTSDSATVTYAGVAGANTASTLNFANVDVLNLVSSSTTAANTTNIVLNATDLEKLVVTGNIKTTVGAGTSTGITEVDASGLKVGTGVEGLTFTQATGSTQNLLVTGSSAKDTVTVASAKGTVIANGGNDTITFSNASVALGDQTVKLSATDFVAGGNVTVAFTTLANGAIDFTSAIENTLKSGGLNLGTATANVVIGSALNANNNVAFDAGTKTLQFDLNGDGVFTAGTDFAVTLTGATGVTYNAAADVFVAA